MLSLQIWGMGRRRAYHFPASYLIPQVNKVTEMKAEKWKIWKTKDRKKKIQEKNNQEIVTLKGTQCCQINADEQRRNSASEEPFKYWRKWRELASEALPTGFIYTMKCYTLRKTWGTCFEISITLSLGMLGLWPMVKACRRWNFWQSHLEVHFCTQVLDKHKVKATF